MNRIAEQPVPLNAEGLAVAFAEILNDHQAAQLPSILDSEYIQHNRYVQPGVEGVVAFFTHFLEAFPDLKVDVEDVITARDRVVGRFTYRGTHLGPFFGAPPTNKLVKMSSIDIWRVENGLLKEHWDEINTLELFQQVGLIPEDMTA